MTTIFKKFATGTAALVLMTTVFATGAMADEGPVTTEIKGTDNVVLTPISSSSFTETITLNGSTQTVTGAAIGTFDVTDARGTGAGWGVTVSATPFSHGANLKTLSSGSLTLSPPEVTLIDPNSSAKETVAPAGGTIDGGSVEVLSAAADSGAGMGSYKISPMAMELELKPKEVYAGTYTSTVTVALTTGP